MIMPYLNEEQTSADVTAEFKGYNHNPVIQDNEFFDMENMTSDRYPIESTRDKRGTLNLEMNDDEEVVAAIGKDEMCVFYKTTIDSDMPNFVDVHIRNPHTQYAEPYFFLKVPINLNSKVDISSLPFHLKSLEDSHFMSSWTGTNVYAYKDAETVDSYVLSPGRFLTEATLRNTGTYGTRRGINFVSHGCAHYKCATKETEIGTDFLMNVGSTELVSSNSKLLQPAMLTEAQFNAARATTAQTSANNMPVYKDAFSDGSILINNKRYSSYEAYQTDMQRMGLTNAYKMTVHRSTDAMVARADDPSPLTRYHRVWAGKSTATAYDPDIAVASSYYNESGALQDSLQSVGFLCVDSDGNIGKGTVSDGEPVSPWVAFVHKKYVENDTQWLKGKELYIGTQDNGSNSYFGIIDNKITVLAASNAVYYTYDSDGTRHIRYAFSANGEYVTVSGYNSRTDHVNYTDFDIYISAADANKTVTLGTTTKMLKDITQADVEALNNHHGISNSKSLSIYWDFATKSEVTEYEDTESSYDLDYGTFLRVFQYNPVTREKSHDTKVCEYVDGEHNLIEMGANIIVLPEKYRINTVQKDNYSYTEIEALEASFSGTIEVSDNVTVGKISANPPDTKNMGSGYDPQEDPETYTGTKVWWDTENKCAKRYSTQTGMWATVDVVVTLKFAASETGTPLFKKGDAVKWNGKNRLVDDDYVNQSYEYLSYKALGEYIAVDHSTTSTVTRLMPAMDYVIECKNRLWGCRYGENDGKTVNEIFASKLGDPSNWHSFANTADDSYYVSLGDKGAFTGAVKYRDNPVFFRADKIHVLTGFYPANYQIKNIDGYGVKPGCHKSITVMNDIAYYLSPMGMVLFNGGIPISLAEAFGEVRYKKCLSGDIGNKLYCSMQNENDEWSLFVFDDSKGVWHREDNLEVLGFCNYSDELFAVKNDSLISLNGIYGDKEDDFEWMLQTGEIGYFSNGGVPFRKRIIKLVPRMNLSLNSRARIEIMYDNDGVWRPVSEIAPKGKPMGYAVPVVPFRCDHYSIRIRGKGKFDLQSIMKFWHDGSEFE